MENILNGAVLVVTLVIWYGIASVYQVGALFPGICYPEKEFYFKVMDEGGSLDVRIVRGSGGTNSLKKRFAVYAISSTNKQYKILRIKRMSYKWEGNTGDFLKGDGYYEGQLCVIDALSKDGYYGYDPFYPLEFNPEKLFKGKKNGDKFKFYLTVVYSFDGEPDITQVFEYDAVVQKGKFRGIWPSR
jgi:hypothetical protein